MGFEEELSKLNERSQAGADTGEDSASEQNDGNEDGDSDTGDTTTADHDDEQGDASDAITTDEEGEEEPKKLSVEDRFKELTDLNKAQAAQIAELEKKFQEKVQVETVDYVEISQEKVDVHVAKLKDEADELKAAGKITDAARKERELFRFLDMLDENEKKRQDYLGRTTPNEEQIAAAKKVDEAAEFYREHHKIPKDVWAASAKTFVAMINADPILMQEYTERVQVSPISAITWAHGLVKKALASNDAEREKREKAKKNVPHTSTETPVLGAEETKIKEKAIESGTAEAWAEHIANITKPKK
jgi:hypothetical protein